MHVKYIMKIQGEILILISIFKLTVFPWIFYFEEYAVLQAMITSLLVPLLLGVLLLFSTKNVNSDFRLKEAYFLVTFSWITMGLIGSLPFFLSGAIPSFTDAVFESISGFTTTGSSILTDIESLPKSILYWRSLTHWIGGMGIIVLVVAIMPNLNVAGYQLFSAEMSGGIENSRLKPRIRETAKRLWGIYLLLTVLVVVFLMLGKVDFFESLCHAFGTVATGGFSTKNASIGHYSPYVQYVILIFMMLSGINFALHYFALKGNFGRIRQNSELKAYTWIISVVGLAITFILFFAEKMTLEHSFRDAFFQVVSIITATGYATADYLQWKGYAWFLILLLMFVGACVGSTGGGIKVVRHVVAMKFMKINLLLLMHPHLVKQIRINGTIIRDEKAVSVIVFMAIYIGIVGTASLLMTFLGLDMQTAIGSVLATMGGIGPGIGDVGPAGNFAQIPDTGKVLLSSLMIIGRLEILTFLVLFTPSYWKK